MKNSKILAFVAAGIFGLAVFCIPFIVIFGTTRPSTEAATPAAFSGGTGAFADPFLISTWQDMRELERVILERVQPAVFNAPNVLYLMTNDIDGGGQAIGIGQHTNWGFIEWHPFRANFDGGGNTLSNVMALQSGMDWGLFGLDGGVIQHLNLVNSDTLVEIARNNAIINDVHVRRVRATSRDGIARNLESRSAIMNSSVSLDIIPQVAIGWDSWSGFAGQVSGSEIRNSNVYINLRGASLNNVNITGIAGSIWSNAAERSLIENVSVMGVLGTGYASGNINIVTRSISGPQQYTVFRNVSSNLNVPMAPPGVELPSHDLRYASRSITFNVNGSYLFPIYVALGWHSIQDITPPSVLNNPDFRGWALSPDATVPTWPNTPSGGIMIVSNITLYAIFLPVS